MSPPTPKMGFNSPQGTPLIFKPVQLKGVEIVALLLGRSVENLPRAQFTIG